MAIRASQLFVSLLDLDVGFLLYTWGYRGM